MRFYHIAFVAVLVASGSSVSVAQDASTKEAVEVRSSLSKDGKTTPCLGACSINFQQALGADFSYLIPLGSQIHAARVTPDPVTLAVAAKSLAAAEAATGKQAQVTSSQVMAEAVELAKLRRDLKELKAIAQLVSDQSKKAELKQLIELTEDLAAESGEATKEVYGTLTVDNHTPHNLRITVDGREVGRVRSGRTGYFRVHAHGYENHFDAYCLEDNEVIAHGNVRGHHHDLRWHIDD
ncbi:hypothetical protein NHH03_16475 [Stieleria sp. TO1_6]|uniref:hypothetical protein n=1 Tax=Stieleria tagensis TaxID=2956795 RepID=UPI00209AEB24|nr:hypothetical protein [Stieleria tagensis]MCO8123347.1 hypothetical protein [Stieleria tagensis]